VLQEDAIQTFASRLAPLVGGLWLASVQQARVVVVSAIGEGVTSGEGVTDFRDIF
jgi:hypothetical protein